MAKKTVYKLTHKGSSQVGDKRISKGDTIEEAAFKKLDAKRKKYYAAVEVEAESPKGKPTAKTPATKTPATKTPATKPVATKPVATKPVATKPSATK